MRQGRVVRLPPAERALLGDLVAAGTAPARAPTRARIPLKADRGPGGPGWPDARIAEAVETRLATAARVRRRWVRGGLDDALQRRPTGPRPRKLDGAAEARLIALACSAPPAGRERWSLRPTAERPVELEVVAGIAPNTVRTVLKTTSASRGGSRGGASPRSGTPPSSPAWRTCSPSPPARSTPRRPLVCFDEASKELPAEVRPPPPTIPGHPARCDAEDERRGTAHLFLWCAPLLGRRQASVTARRPRLDWAHAIKELVDVDFPAAERIVLVLDDLNTHAPASLSPAFPPVEAKRLWDRPEVHHTPKRGSWLSVAELELSALGRQCLHRRLPDRHTPTDEVAAWVAARNAAAATVDRRFTAAAARVKLQRRYPVLEPAI